MEGNRLKIIIAFSFIAILISITAVATMAFYVKNILDNIEKMLDEAFTGNFTDKHYDERRMSRLENKLGRFLLSNSLSKKKLQSEREEIQKMVSDISHQTKTPVTNIILYTQLMEGLLNNEEEKRLASQILNQAGRLSFLIQLFVKISHLETGIVNVNPCLQPAALLLEYIQEAYNGRAEQKNIHMSVETTEEKAVYDLKWTREAIGNIVDNAIKYTHSGGKIKVYVKSFEMFIAIVIKDNGIGIEEEEQAAIFNRFYRSQDAGQDEGTGIGLYLARKIISMENGYIKVKSEPGKGSEFFIYLKKS